VDKNQTRRRKEMARFVVLLLLFAVLGAPARSFAQDTPLDYTDDQVSDFVVVRNTGGGTSGAITWFVANAVTSSFSYAAWGERSDIFVSGDFDGDGRSDMATWRAGLGGTAGFWIRPSSTGVGYFESFGVTGDDPTVVGDYDGDGRTDLAVFRPGATAGSASYWFYRRSSDGVVVAVQWGVNGDFPAPGDYDGDGRYDPAIQRNAGGGYGLFYIRQTTAGPTAIYFGTPTDVIAPGDYDGDGKTDIALLRYSPSGTTWWIRRSSDGVAVGRSWGNSTGDLSTQGDYDGDGKTDLAIWRPGTGEFWVAKSSGGTLVRTFGVFGDRPVAFFNTH
jgi:spore coat protein A, manganese oxidase